MDVVSFCSLRASGFIWQPVPGSYMQTVVVKATYQLAPNASPLASEQEEVNEEDNHWNDDPARSVAAPSDLAPFKPAADIMLVGHAFAPGGTMPVRALTARVMIGEIDKSIEVWCDRAFQAADGKLLEGARFTKMPLRWERAAGGPDTNNPVGMRFDAPPDKYGVIPIPNLQPPGMLVAQRPDTFPPACFAPIGARWPARVARLARTGHSTFAPGWERRPLPEGVDYGYFQSAPPDQQASLIRPNERIVLENLHPTYPRLVTNLPDVSPRALVEPANGSREEIALAADTLWIDTDRGICTVVWRGRIALRDPSARGQIKVTLAGASAESVVELTADEFIDADAPPAPEPDDMPEMATMSVDPVPPAPSAPSAPSMPSVPSVPSGMPFQSAPASPSRPRTDRPLPPTGDSALPFMRPGSATMKSDPYIAPPAPAPRPEPFTPPPAPAPVARPPRPITLSMEDGQGFAPPSGPSPAASPPPGLPLQAPSAPAAAPPSIVNQPAYVMPQAERAQAPAPVSPWAMGDVAPRGQEPAPALGLSPGAAGLSGPSTGLSGAVGASNTAAAASASAIAAVAPWSALQRQAPVVEEAPKVEPAATRDLIELLWFDPAAVARMRREPAWRELLVSAGGQPRSQTFEIADAGQEPWEAEDRREVFEIVTRARPAEPAGVADALDDAISDDGKFIPPQLLLAGELELPFDELSALKAALSTAAPLVKPAPADEDLRASVSAAKELLQTPGLSAAPAVCEGLTDRIREAFAKEKTALPEGYLDTQMERVLLSERQYQKRKVLGAVYLRALLWLRGESEPLVAYLPEDLSGKLPMYRRFGARIAVEVHPKKDQYERREEALRALALGVVTKKTRRAR